MFSPNPRNVKKAGHAVPGRGLTVKVLAGGVPGSVAQPGDAAARPTTTAARPCAHRHHTHCSPAWQNGRLDACDACDAPLKTAGALFAPCSYLIILETNPMPSKKMPTPQVKPQPGGAENSAVEPTLHRQSKTSPQVTQDYGVIIPMPHGMKQATAASSVGMLNQVLADTITLRDMYKKHHWQVVGPTFNQLHLMYDKHYEAQVELVDSLAERIQILGGVSLAMAADIAEETRIPRPPRGREPAAVQLTRLIDAHTLILKESRELADKAGEAGDSGTDDLLVSQVVRCNELQVWFLSEHLVAAMPI